MRLLTSVAALGRGPYLLTGTERMHERPIQHLLDALAQLNVSAISLNRNGCPRSKSLAVLFPAEILKSTAA
ncbi:MAG: hypothetical protein R2875_03675 [Desulfobacterales bacterium]